MKYLVYYDTPDNKAEKRNYNLAATNKIDYICEALNKMGHPVELISASSTCNRKGCPGQTRQLTEGTVLNLFPCLGTGILPKRLLGRWLLKLRIFLYLCFHLRRGENLLVYHSLGYAELIAFLRKVKNFRLILEVEEIYADISGREKDRKKEYKAFTAADAYVFPTVLLNEKLNTQNKPYLLNHGTYRVEPDRKCSVFAGEGGKQTVHCVYAGTFSAKKGGALAAVNAAEYLPEGYHVHILGGGGKGSRGCVQSRIEELSRTCACKLTYDGVLVGNDYIRFLQSCHIGLSTQNPEGDYNDTSFPSKILSYMSNGLRVVSVPIPAVKTSGIGPYMHYYDRQDPQVIANAIRGVDLEDDYDARKILAGLDEQFRREMKLLLEGHNAGS